MPFLSLASQKNYCSLYAMSLYVDGDDLETFKQRWQQTGRKLNMGKSCIRFKSVSELAMELIVEHLRAISVDDWIATYEGTIKR